MKIGKEESKKKVEPLEAGMISAVCFGLVDLGLQENIFGGNSQRKVLFMFEVDSQLKSESGETYNRTISRDFTFSFNEKASLRKMLESWNAKKFTENDMENGVELKDYLGKPCFLNIVHVERESGVYANIAGIMSPIKGAAHLKPLNKLLYFEMNPAEIPKEDIKKAFETLPEWVRKRIEKSPTYAEIFNKGAAVELKPVESEDLPF